MGDSGTDDRAGVVTADRAAVFLDRDGVISELVWHEVDHAYESAADPDRVALMAGVPDALKAIRDAGFLTVVVSNQPAAAKGTASRQDLVATHDRIVALLAEAGVELDAFRYCLHHPRGVESELSRRSSCRKPEPGLILRAADDFDIDLERSWMVGDADRDVEAGRRAGCCTILVENPRSSHRRKGSSGPDYLARDLAEAAVIVTAGRP
jgi:D-glycero-D-manno-heptose 1,7-bisphosphate phosphatase